MDFQKIITIQGPSVWSTLPVLEVWTDLGPYRGSSCADLQAVVDRLVRWGRGHLTPAELPLPDEGRPADLYLARWVERLTRRLQSLCGVELSAGRVETGELPGRYLIAIRYDDEGLARPCLTLARELISAALQPETTASDAAGLASADDFPFVARLHELQALANEICLGPSTRAIVEAARARGIPVRRLNEESLVQFGYGTQQRRICTAETDGTGAIAESIAQDKELTKTLLRRAAIPVPEGRPVDNAQDAWEAAREVGLPVVVKPRDANHGRGVAIKLSQRERIEAAYQHAAQEGSGVLVEQFVFGVEHRLLVVGNRVVAAARGEPDQVIGDGRLSIAELVDAENRDPRRGDEFARPMCKLRLDPIALLLLDQQGFKAEMVPAAGATVVLHRNGEFTTDVTDQLHPEVAARAVLAARVVGLDVAGIDLIAADISRPLEDQGGMIIEVNAGPGLQMHAQPQIGRPRPVGAAIVDTLYPDGQTGRIPIIAVVGELPSEKTGRLAAYLLTQSGLTVGMTTTSGTFVGGRHLGLDQRGAPPSAAALLLNPLIEAAVLNTSARVVLGEGLAFYAADVVIVEPSEGSPAPDDDPRSRQPLWRRTVVDTVLPTGAVVLDADDPVAPLLARRCRSLVLHVHPEESNLSLAAHRQQGGKAAFIRDAHVWLAAGAEATSIGSVSRFISSQPDADLRHLMRGIAAAWCAGVPADILRKGLETFAGFAPADPGPTVAPACSPDSSGLPCPEQPRAA